MRIGECPSCGAEIVFESPALPVKVCDFCRTTVIRDGEALRAAGKVAILPFDVSPLQLGTRLTDGGESLRLVGRLRWRWAAGAWNEWLFESDRGVRGWVGEAMGRFMLLRAVDAVGVTPQAVRETSVGKALTLGGVRYAVTDVKTAKLVGAEGELASVPTGFEILSLDMTANGGRCASVQLLHNKVEAYHGRFATLEELAPAGLREVPGWSLPSFAHV